MYSGVAGSSSCFEFQSRFGGQLAIYHRRLPCRCESCRVLQQGGSPDDYHCVLTIEAGDWKATKVVFKSALASAATKKKKATAKAKRAAATAHKVARLVADVAAFQGHVEGAPNPQAAVAAADLTDRVMAAQTGANGLSAAAPFISNVAFAAAYGAEDARQVAASRGEKEFLYRCADRIEEGSSDEEED